MIFWLAQKLLASPASANPEVVTPNSCLVQYAQRTSTIFERSSRSTTSKDRVKSSKSLIGSAPLYFFRS
jgi:hypothetical protein